MTTQISAEKIKKEVRACGSKAKAEVLQRFFKTGPGEYGEGDVFIGAKVPELRKVARANREASFTVLKKLIRSKVHEDRLVAILILVERFKKGEQAEQKTIYDFYLEHTAYINNWDLVDLSAGYIVGGYLSGRSKKPLSILARSHALWERRIAIIATFYFIRDNKYGETLRISRMLLKDEHDLIHKAVGWMLREVGKRDLKVEEEFLKKHYKTMPRTMLRYAIERFPEKKRQAYLKGVIS